MTARNKGRRMKNERLGRFYERIKTHPLRRAIQPVGARARAPEDGPPPATRIWRSRRPYQAIIRHPMLVATTLKAGDIDPARSVGLENTSGSRAYGSIYLPKGVTFSIATSTPPVLCCRYPLPAALREEAT